jgi:hypothetical protein
MENHHFQWENPLLMAIFNSYVKLPEGKKKRQGWRISLESFFRTVLEIRFGFRFRFLLLCSALLFRFSASLMFCFSAFLAHFVFSLLFCFSAFLPVLFLLKISQISKMPHLSESDAFARFGRAASIASTATPAIPGEERRHRVRRFSPCDNVSQQKWWLNMVKTMEK